MYIGKISITEPGGGSLSLLGTLKARREKTNENEKNVSSNFIYYGSFAVNKPVSYTHLTLPTTPYV